jgi:hypothetical protein
MSCKYYRESGEYLVDGKPCKVDEYGDPTKHCTMKATCSHHIGYGELTCARCIGDVRGYLRRIVDLSALMPTATLESRRVDSEAAVLAGPGSDYATFVARRRIGQQWIEANLPESRQLAAAEALLEDDDERHPYNVLTRWQAMIREDYRQPLVDKNGEPLPYTIANSAGYLSGQLGRIAQDDEQDFPLFAREIRKCARHMESVMATTVRAERGAPCPECVGGERKPERLVREYGHWCEREDCRQQFHYDDDSGDKWICPIDRSHWWAHEDYEKWIEERGGKRGKAS